MNTKIALLLAAGCLTGPLTSPGAPQYQHLRSFGEPGMVGQTPVSRVIERGDDGALYGTAAYDFIVADMGGVAFRVNKDGSDYRVLHHFGGGGDGWGLFAGLVQAGDGTLYGTTYGGGSDSVGTLFQLQPDGNGYVILRHFSAAGIEGRTPGELTAGRDGALYGTTRYGGMHTNAAGDGMGTVFKVNRNGSGYTVLHHFGSVPNDGANPVSALIEGSDGVLYGTTEFGGANSIGTVFRLNTDGGSYAILRHLGSDATDGSRPKAALIEASDGRLYGATVYTGNNFTRVLGTVFGVNRDGGGYAVLHRFTITTGEGIGPYGALVEGPDGALYGTAFSRGSFQAGTLFKVNKDGTGYTTIHQFAGSPADGDGPRALTLASDGAIYGVTERGGANINPLNGIGAGTLFRLHWPLVITRYERGSGSAALGWTGVPLWPYRVQARTDLPDSGGAWDDLGTTVTAPDGTGWLSLPEPPIAPARFYRIVGP